MKGDFTGFSFDGIHCSELNIVRVSEGDRYEEELFPELDNRTNEIIGADGENYYGSEYRAKTITISIAFDSMTELQFRRVRKLFGTKKICELILDERPYKVYSVKIASPIKLDYVCFDSPKVIGEETRKGVRRVEKDGVKDWEDVVVDIYDPVKTQRIYKGEGEIELIAPFPFARQLYKVLDLYEDDERFITTYNNVDEWDESSGILSQKLFDDYNIDKTQFDDTITGYNLKIPVYNPGDLNTGFYLYIPFTNNSIEPEQGQDYVKIYGDNNGLKLKKINKKGDDTGIIINTVNHLIEGVKLDPITERFDFRTKTWKTTGNIYNENIVEGDFPKIMRSDWYLDDYDYKQAIYISCYADGAGANEEYDGLIQINYDYLYF